MHNISRWSAKYLRKRSVFDTDIRVYLLAAAISAEELQIISAPIIIYSSAKVMSW